MQEKVKEMQLQETDFVRELIERSIGIKTVLSKVIEGKGSVKKLENAYSQVDFKCSELVGLNIQGDQHSPCYQELKDHWIQIYQQIGIGLIKKSQSYEDKLEKQT
jgi:hypothetical protein